MSKRLEDWLKGGTTGEREIQIVYRKDQDGFEVNLMECNRVFGQAIMFTIDGALAMVKDTDGVDEEGNLFGHPSLR